MKFLKVLLYCLWWFLFACLFILLGVVLVYVRENRTSNQDYKELTGWWIVNNEDIVLKSKGTQYYSFTYVYDAVLWLFTILLNGSCGEAYNISNIKSDITLANLAKIIAEAVKKKVVFEIPNETESKWFSKATKARLDSEKIQSIGYKPIYDIKKGVERTISILKEIHNK